MTSASDGRTNRQSSKQLARFVIPGSNLWMWTWPRDLSIYLSLNTATRPRGHFRQVSAASVSIRQEKIKYRQRIKSMIVKDKNR